MSIKPADKKTFSVFRRVGLVAATASFVVSACSSSADESAGSSPESDPSVEADTPAATSDAANGAATDQVSEAVDGDGTNPDGGNDSDVVFRPERYNLALAVGLTADADGIIRAAWRSIYNDCISAAGYAPLPDLPRVEPDDPADRLTRERFDDFEAIANEGYGYLFGRLTQDFDVFGSEDETGFEELELPPDDMLPSDNTDVWCKKTANDRMSPQGSAFDEQQFVLQADTDIFDRALAHPDMIAADADWVSCMSQSGFDFSSASQAATKMFEFVRDSVASDEEIAMALTDAECRQESRIIDVRLALQETFVEEWIADNAAFVTELRERVKSEVDTAREVLSE